MNTQFLISLLIGFIYYLIIDGTMLTLYMGKRFSSMIKKIQNGEDMKTRIIPGIICFLVLSFGINYFVLDKINDNNILLDSLKYGLPFGLVVYGVYDLTNIATFHKYTFETMIIDIVWGGILAFIVTFLLKITNLKIKNKRI